jgi:hypothetical protein
MEDVVTVGREFGTVVMVEEMTFAGLEAAVEKIRADYEHHHQHDFPFYKKQPQIVISNHGSVFDEDMVPSELHTVIGWYLVVPTEHVVQA